MRLLLDAWGAHPIESNLVDDMQNAGVQVRWFRPLHRLRIGDLNHRTHRKVLITDESAGFTGGVGISDLWRGDARDGPSGVTRTFGSRVRRSTACGPPFSTTGSRLTRHYSTKSTIVSRPNRNQE